MRSLRCELHKRLRRGERETMTPLRMTARTGQPRPSSVSPYISPISPSTTASPRGRHVQMREGVNPLVTGALTFHELEAAERRKFFPGMGRKTGQGRGSGLGMGGREKKEGHCAMCQIAYLIALASHCHQTSCSEWGGASG